MGGPVAKIKLTLELDNLKIVTLSFEPTMYKDFRGNPYFVSSLSPIFIAFKNSWMINYKKQFGDCGTGSISIEDFMKIVIIEGRGVSSIKKKEKIHPTLL